MCTLCLDVFGMLDLFAGVRHGGTNNTTLELRKIPREQNIIANINDHFSKFGIIVNLQVCSFDELRLSAAFVCV